MCKQSFNNGARHGEASAAKKIEDMKSTLKVIYTWASFDHDRGVITKHNALDGEHVMALCEKALNGE